MQYSTYISLRRLFLFALIPAFSASCLTAQSSAHPELTSQTSQQASPARPLHTIVTLREAHGLSVEEARRGYPIHLRAVVTYYDVHVDTRHVAFFLQDRTGGIFAAAAVGTTWSGRPPLPGTLVDVSGISGAGDFAPIIDKAHLTVLGQSHLPTQARPVTFSHLITGTEDGQWVEIEGVVHSVLESADGVTLRIAMPGGTVGALAVREPGVDYQHLVDSWVRVRGNAAPTFNANRQLTGTRIFFPGLQSVTTLSISQLDAFSLPVQPITSLMRFNPTLAWPHRIHVRGTVALYWPGRMVCIKDNTEGICAQTTQKMSLAEGALVDIAGFTTLAGLRPALEDAVFRPLPGSGTVAIGLITPEQALLGNDEAELVHIDGRLIGRDLESSDTTLVLSSGGFIFRVILPGTLTNKTIAALQNGTLLRITGICSVKVDSKGTLQGYGITQASQFSILLRSSQDVLILQTPSWWTATRLQLIVPYVLAITLVVAIWIFVLRRRVEQQTREISESRERYRYMALHDTLTGLPTRAVLHDHLQVGLERSKRFKKSLALLMLDLDNFKQVNDSFGHESGDEVLRITADRLSTIIRKTDCVARMGGDEFIILLNDLADPGHAELVAGKIVAMLSQPVLIGTIEVAVSVSVGVCTLSDGNVDASSLLQRVDAAMYRAKARGRGCFQVFSDDLITTPLSEPSVVVSFTAALNGEQQLQNAPLPM